MSVIVELKCCTKSEIIFTRKSLNEHQKHGNLRDLTWNIMKSNGCNLKIKDGVDHWKCIISFLLFIAEEN